MRSYKILDHTGVEREIEEHQLYQYVKRILLPILTESGIDATRYDGDLYNLIGAVVGHLRELHGTLGVARKEYRRLKQQREDDYHVIVRFLRTAQSKEAHNTVV